MKNQSKSIDVAVRFVPGLARHFQGPICFWIWLVLALALHQRSSAQLAITEAMSWSWSTNGMDYWELSNFGTNEINLTGYRFNDSDPDPGGIVQAYEGCFAGLVIKAQESIIFYETNALSPDDFRRWWGLTNVRVIPYPASGYGLSERGDKVLLWDRDDNLVDSFAFGQAEEGFSFTYDSITGDLGVQSVVNVDGAFVAAIGHDIGSPGTNTGRVALSFAEQPVSVVANPGDAVTFSVGHRGLPRPAFQWFHMNAPIPDARDSSHTVEGVQSASGGSYFVVLSNYFQVVTSATATLTISTSPVPPQFIQSPTDLWVFPDQEANFHSVATGLPQPSYQWRRDGIDKPGETHRDLKIYPPHELGTDVYSVVASNPLGAATNEAKLLVFERPDLRITELMAVPTAGYEDWWELTNFGTNAVDLFGYRFDDFTQIGNSKAQPLRSEAWVLTNHVIISPGESIVFVENMGAEGFRHWWGQTNLLPALQIITYSGGGLSFENNGSDGLGLWNMGAMRNDDYVCPPASYSSPSLGVSFTIDPDLPEDLCCFLLSTPGTNGAFIAAEGGDIGSPGWFFRHPRILSIEREPSGWLLTWSSVVIGSYLLQWRESLTTGSWTTLATVPAGADTTSYSDTSTAVAQRFYRVLGPR